MASAASPSSQDISKDAGKQNPFVVNPHGHPQFSPIKHGTKFAVSGTDTLKLPKTSLEKPLTPYLRYFRQMWDELKAAHQQLILKDIGKIIRQKWRDLPDGEKQEFVEEYETEMIEYERTLQVRAQHNSAAYQARLATAKSGVSIPLQTATVAPPDPPVVVHSLTMHQKKLETELQQIEEKFDSKKRKFVESSSAFQEDLVEQQTEIIKKPRERERERQAELMRERDAAAAAVAALQAEKEAAIAAATAAAAAASAPTPPTPVEPMVMDDASSAMVKEEPQKEGIVSVAAPLEIKPEESTLAPPVNQETPSFAPVPIETVKETKPAITEPVKVDEPKREESPAAGPPPAAPTPAIDTPPVQAAPVVEVAPANPVEATPVAPAVMEHAPAVEAPQIAVQAAPAVAEPPSVIQVVGTPTQSTSKEERKMSRKLLKNKEKKMAAKAAKRQKGKEAEKEEPNPYWTEPDGFEANISFPRKKQ